MKSSATITNFIQRFLGLAAFTLMFFQIVLGAFMQKWTERLGGWIFKFHIIQGVVIYLLVLLHPFFFILYNYSYGKGFDPFYVFTQICVLCKPPEIYYSLGRVSFWLINIVVFTALFRSATPYLRVNWRKFHVINYVVFILIGIHGFSNGTDFRIMPFFGFAMAAYLIVVYIIIRKLPSLFSFLKVWLKS